MTSWAHENGREVNELYPGTYERLENALGGKMR
jgi:hypothetical protein